MGGGTRRGQARRGRPGQAITVLLASLGSPLGAYAATDLSESLQAACLALALVASLEARRHPARIGALRWAAAAGLAAGTGILAKSALFAVAPLALLPLLSRRAVPSGAGESSRLAAAVAGAAPALASWAWFEISRFGELFGGYQQEGFTFPFLVGAFRLLVGPAKGVFLFFPALAVALVEAYRRVRAPSQAGPDGEATVRRLEVAAALLPLAALLAIASSWWASSGTVGWGPRLLVPGIPGAAALAATAIERWNARRARLLVGVSIALNALGIVQSPLSVFVVTGKLNRIEVSTEVARRFLRNPVPSDGGRVGIAGSYVIHEEPWASDFVTHAWMLWVRAAPDDLERGRRLDAPPWLGRRPDLGLRLSPYPRPVTAAVAPPLSVGFLGRSLLGGKDPARGDVYARALADQVLRAQQQRKLERAFRLATLLFELGPERESAALLAETYRLLGRHEILRAFLDALPRELRGTPRSSPCSRSPRATSERRPQRGRTWRGPRRSTSRRSGRRSANPSPSGRPISLLVATAPPSD